MIPDIARLVRPPFLFVAGNLVAYKVGEAGRAVALDKFKKTMARVSETIPTMYVCGALDAPDKASLEGPSVVWAGGGTRQAPLPMHLKLLVAPIAGMLAGTLEITSLWPMEWAKVQIQLNKGVPGWSLMGDVRRVGMGLYKGLPAMLVGVPLQGAVRVTAHR